MSTIRPVVAALLIAGPVAAQETTNNPFPDPIPASEGMIVVGLEEFATLPDIDGAAARPMVLVDEPSSERLFVNDMWGLLYGISYSGDVTQYLDVREPRWGVAVQTPPEVVRIMEVGLQSFAFHPHFNEPGTMRIGIIGSGLIGGAVGLQWARAGHEILFSSRHPEELMDLVQRAGSRTRAGLPAEAAEFGDVVFVAVPYAALPQVGRDYAPLMEGKVVIDCGNPYPRRDGPMAAEALEKGTGVASAEFLPGVRLVRAFNAIGSRSVDREAHREGEKVAIPIAGDDEEAVRIASELVVDAGFDPVVVGGLSRAREFDQGSAVYVRDMTAAELREALGLG